MIITLSKNIPILNRILKPLRRRFVCNLLIFRTCWKIIFSLWTKLDPCSSCTKFSTNVHNALIIKIHVFPPLRILAVSNSASAPKMRRWELEIIRENTSIKNTQPMKKSKTSCRGWSLVARLQKTRIWRLCRRLIFENSIPLHYIFTRTAVPFWSPVAVRHHRTYVHPVFFKDGVHDQKKGGLR